MPWRDTAATPRFRAMRRSRVPKPYCHQTANPLPSSLSRREATRGSGSRFRAGDLLNEATGFGPFTGGGLFSGGSKAALARPVRRLESHLGGQLDGRWWLRQVKIFEY